MGTTQSSYYNTTSGPEEKHHMKGWMSSLKDESLLSVLSIPGTHNSVVFYGGDSVECQSWSVEKQLEAGIRFFDIYCYYSKGAVWIYGGGTGGYDLTMDTVLREMSKFLKLNVKEFIILRITTDSHYYDRKNAFSKEFLKAVSNKENRILHRKITKCPTVGELRGYIVVMHNATYIKCGLYEFDHQVHLSDGWRVPTLFHRWTKWRHVEAHIDAARKEESKIYITYCSDMATMLAYPYAVAYYVNYYLERYIDRLYPVEKEERIGIIAMDYPGTEVIKKIVGLNKYH